MVWVIWISYNCLFDFCRIIFRNVLELPIHAGRSGDNRPDIEKWIIFCFKFFNISSNFITHFISMLQGEYFVPQHNLKLLPVVVGVEPLPFQLRVLPGISEEKIARRSVWETPVLLVWIRLEEFPQHPRKMWPWACRCWVRCEIWLLVAWTTTRNVVCD